MKGNFLQDFRKKRQLEIGLKLDNQLTCWMLILFFQNMLHQSMFKISTDTPGLTTPIGNRQHTHTQRVKNSFL